MIFKLQEGFSQRDLQKSYKKLVKKYHPDFNPENQEWAHKRMTEINLAYELCLKKLEEKTSSPPLSSKAPEAKEKINTPPASSCPRPFKVEPRPASPVFWKSLIKTARRFSSASEIFFEYGLENRKIRREGVRRFRYRECLHLLEELLPDIFALEKSCVHQYDDLLARLYIRFTGNFYSYALIKEKQIPSHPRLDKHWNAMELYLMLSMKDYLSPHLIQNFRKIHWGTAITMTVNEQLYLRRRFPELQGSHSFQTCFNLADSYIKIREEEMRGRVQYFSLKKKGLSGC